VMISIMSVFTHKFSSSSSSNHLCTGSAMGSFHYLLRQSPYSIDPGQQISSQSVSSVCGIMFFSAHTPDFIATNRINI
jgi:hypothetical protein